jgi:isoquinoline 1-oxidoreductase beta subunit
VSRQGEREGTAISRRMFLAGSGALVLGVGLTACTEEGARVPRVSKPSGDAGPSGAAFAPDAFVRIAPDDTVTVVVKHLEMGQGPYTGLATLVAEELDADWPQMRVVSAPADDSRYKNLLFGVQGTGGSSSIANAYYQMRNAGAAARQMLVRAAADEWGVAANEIEISRGVLSHPASGRTSGYGALVAAASAQPVPESPTLKSPAEFVFIGRELPRIDTAEKSDGSARFTIDAYRDGMLTVLVERPPAFGARVRSFDASAAEATAGVVAVREVPEGVAVYAEDTWAAMQGRQALSVDWDESAAETRSTQELFGLFRKRAQTPGTPAASRGDAASAIEAAAERPDVFVADAEYAFPYLAHAPMEPLDALLEIDPEDDGEAVLVTMGSQGPGRDRPAIAEALGLPIEKVRFDVQLAGGSFGRRSQHDASFPKEAAHVFMAQPAGGASRRPTKLLWTREDDIRGGYYRPMVVHRLRGAMTRGGELIGWDQTIAAQSWAKGTPSEARFENGIDRTVVEGASNLSYATDDLRVTQHLVDVGVPTLWWRSVGHTHTGFAVEAFIDELLEGAGRDPVAGRLALLEDKPRHRGVLTRAAELADWGRPTAEGRAFGVAVHESFGTFVAQIVEIEAATTPVRKPQVKRVWCAVDCGIAVNPNVIRAQMEGGIGFGLGAALYSEIHLDPGGHVRESNFDRYRNLRIEDMPEVEVAIVASSEDPRGVGEPGVPPIAPAVANAWRRLTRERVSQLPFVRGA